MKRIEILPGIETSALGFGCAPILGSVDAETSRIALRAALDAGITHFDLARSYGYGQAESFVGQLLRSRRHEVTIATKFGIRATKLAGALAPLKPILRALKKRKASPPTPAPADPAPPATSAAPPGSNPLANLLHQRIPLTPTSMKASLETSLRELHTDYVDFLFIHEPRNSIEKIDDLVAVAQSLKASGKIRSFGLAIMMADRARHAQYLSAVDLLQFDNSPGLPHYAETVSQRATEPNIFFSPFRHRQPGQSPLEVIRQLSADFPQSIILCSMFKPEHIRQNAAAIAG